MSLAPGTVKVGVWREVERVIDRCPSYYAADHERLRTIAGEYDARLIFSGGYTVPMPQWLVVGIPGVRVSGALYSGCGGLNFAKRDLPAGEAVSFTVQTYPYHIPELVAAGRLVLLPGFEWLMSEHSWQHPDAPKDWNAVCAMREASLQ